MTLLQVPQMPPSMDPGSRRDDGRMGLKARILSAATAMLLGLAAFVFAGPGFSQTPAPVPFKMHRSKIMFDAIVEGRKASALLDSGADFSVVDSTFAAAAGLKGGKAVAIAATSGNISTQIVPAVRLEIPGALKATMPMLSADLSQASRLIGRPIDIIVGGDVMRKNALSLSFSRNRFDLVPTGAQPAGYTAIALTRVNQTVLVPVMIGGRTLRAQIDFGSGSDLRISPEAWAQARPPGVRVTSTVSGAVNGRLTTERKARIPELHIGRFVEQQADIRIAPMPRHLVGHADALLGLGVLARYDLLLDIPAGALWLRPRPSLTPRRIERTGLMTGLDGDGLKVLHVSEGSPAQAGGWKAGDRICRINDVAVDASGRTDQLWAYGAEGSRVRIGLCTGEARELTLRTYY